MLKKLLSSTTLRALVIVYVMIAAGFVIMYSNPLAAAQSAASKGTLTIGLQNDMTSLNFFDPASNSVWKAYQIEWGFESLFGEDPAFASFPVLADPAAGGTNCPSGSVGGPGYCIDASGLNVTVFYRTGIKFQDGTSLTVQDVIFSFQAMAWSTESTGITSSIWWPTPRVPLWNSSTYGGSCAPASMCMSHVAVEAGSAANSVVFHLYQPYALFFYDTLFDAIVPVHIWQNHMDSAAPINFSDPSLGPISDSWDRSVDFGYGSQASQMAATIGTGPFELVYWARGFNSTVRANPNYWGKGVAAASHVWAGTTYPFYPEHVTTIEFKVYGSLDVVSLALQKGEVDTLLWSLTPGFVTQVQSNPAIGIATSTDSGYFYIAFNMRKSPWNDLCMRQAISMAIDKNYIVQTLLGGFGTAGTVPIGETNTLYINTTASPPAFDLAGIDPLLDGCGYIKNPATGFYTMPDGTPISASILTPPKDYDPVRADAGIMISKNLKSVGLDIDVAPTSFDTIVTKAFTQPVDFDIYILGWSLGDFPEAYLCAFFCGNQDVNLNPAGSNSPGYHNPVVDSLIHQKRVTIDTTARVKLVKDVEGILTHDIPWNVLYYRKNINAYRTDTWQGWIPVSGGGSGNLGIYNFWSLTSLAPAGTQQSHGSTGALQVALSVPDQVFARESVPMDVYVAQNQAPASQASVVVNISSGAGAVPCSATVTVGCYNTTTYTTDASGHAHLGWTVPILQGNVIVAVSATKGGVTGSNTKIMESTIGPPLPIAQLSLSTPTPVIAPGGTATITASVTDGLGDPIAGAPITVDTKLLIGSISPLTGTTSASGTLALTYTAPALSSWPVPNGHLLDYIKATTSVANTVIGVTQAATQVMSIQNDAPPAWFIVNTTAPLAGFEVNPAAQTMDVTVQVHRFDGSAVGAGFVVDANVSDTNNVTVTPSATTDATGTATFTVTEAAAAVSALNNTNVWIRFFVHGAANTTSDQILFLVSDGTTTGYSARVSFTDRAMQFSPDMAQNNATVTVWNELGLPVSGVPVFFQINYGPLGVPAQFPYTYDYGTPQYNASPGSGANLDMNEAGGGSLGGVFQNSTGQGAAYGVENWFNDYEIENDFNNFATGTTIDACDPSTWVGGFNGEYFFNATSVTGATGTYNATFYGLPIRLDSEIQVRAYISEPGKVAQAISDLWTQGSCGFAYAYANAMRIDSGVVSQRAPMFGLGSIQTFVPKYTNTQSGPVAQNNPSTTPAPVFSSQQPAVTLVAHFYALNGASPGKVEVFLGSGIGRSLKSVLGRGGSLNCFGTCSLVTNSAGYLNYTFTSPIYSLSQYLEFTWVDADAHWASGAREQLYSGCTAPCFDAASNGAEFGDYWISPTFASLLNKVAFSVDLPYMYLPTSTAFLTVQTNSALLAPGSTGTATVHVWSVLTGEPIGGAAVWSGNSSVLTDDTGMATYNFTVTQMGAVENLVVATTPYGGYARGWYSYVSSLPVLSYSALSVAAGNAGSTTYINATLTNTIALAGTTTVWLYVNNNPVAAQQVTLPASGSQAVSFGYVFASAGDYNVTIGTPVLKAAGQTASIKAAPAGISGVDPLIAYGLAGGLLVLGLVVGVVLGMMLRGRRKPPAMPMEAEEKPAEGGKPAEEELGSEEQL